VSPRRPTDAEIDAALEALSDPEGFRTAESRVAEMAPQLQHILARALHEGGWFDTVQEAELVKAITAPEDAERIAAVRTLLAEETRMGMLVGVAVGWELARRLEGAGDRDERG
jgi:hypothetical protein